MDRLGTVDVGVGSWEGREEIPSQFSQLGSESQ